MQKFKGITSLIYSRKFWLLLFGIIQTVVLNNFNVDLEVWAAIDALVGFLILAIAHEDTARI